MKKYIVFYVFFCIHLFVEHGTVPRVILSYNTEYYAPRIKVVTVT